MMEGDLEWIPDNYSCKLKIELGGMVAQGKLNQFI